jgi:hypothetical protein
MTRFLSLKSVLFYGGTLVAVIALFSIATAYGEANLRAPDPIDGFYSIQGAMPGCLKNQDLRLLVDQSGLFLNGALLPATANPEVIQSTRKRPPLTGRWDNQTLTLIGSLPQLANCRATVIIQGSIDHATLKGQLFLGNSSTGNPFTAEREAPAPVRSTH